MTIPSKDSMTSPNTTEAQFKIGIDNIIDYLGSVESQSLTFSTTAELELAKPKVGQKAKTLDSGKVWEWNGSKWVDTGEGELDRANEYTDSFDALTYNKYKVYPFMFMPRDANNYDGIRKFHRDNILNIEVTGAEPNKVYFFVGYRAQTVVGGLPAHSWCFADCDASEWATSDPALLRRVVEYKDNTHKLEPNTGVHTITLISSEVKSLNIKLTIDTENLPTEYIFTAQLGTIGSNYIVHPDRISINNQDSVNETIDSKFLNTNSLLINKNVVHPFKFLNRNPENLQGSGGFQRNHILNIEVIGARDGKGYAFRGYRNQTVTSLLQVHGWAFTEIDLINPSSDGITVVNYNSAIYPIFPNTGIQTLNIKSDVIEGLYFKVTVDTASMTTNYINYSADFGYGYNYIVDPDNYLQIKSVSNERQIDKSAIRDLRESLSNPYKSVVVTLIGDSNCWASGATGKAPTEPRNLRLSDVRNNYTCNAFANLLRKWIGYSAGGIGEPIELNQAWIDSTSLNPNKSKWSGFAGFKVATSIPLQDFSDQLTLNDDENSSSKYSLAIIKDRTLEFDIFGDNISISYSTQSIDQSAKIMLSLGQLSVEQSTYSETRQTKEISASLAKVQDAKVKVASDVDLNVESIKHNRTVGLYNNGISGSGIGAWAPNTTRSLIVEGVPDYTTHLLMWFGSNEAEDRSITTSMFYYRNLVNWLQLNRTKTKLVTLKPSRTNEVGVVDDVYLRAIRADAYVRESIKRGIDVIDCWGATSIPIIYGENFWTDGTHLTDQGHKYVFESIVENITLS